MVCHHEYLGAIDKEIPFALDDAVLVQNCSRANGGDWKARLELWTLKYRRNGMYKVACHLWHGMIAKMTYDLVGGKQSIVVMGHDRARNSFVH
mmetsp:Transcript_59061/g.175609  ORF Transcript_59061/g.175609 Transcript_59061/m.175609 type:complete len:93 (+) Transcript_59061:541-819(+)